MTWYNRFATSFAAHEMGYLIDVASFLADSGTESKPVGVWRIPRLPRQSPTTHLTGRAE